VNGPSLLLLVRTLRPDQLVPCSPPPPPPPRTEQRIDLCSSSPRLSGREGRCRADLLCSDEREYFFFLRPLLYFLRRTFSPSITHLTRGNSFFPNSSVPSLFSRWCSPNRGQDPLSFPVRNPFSLRVFVGLSSTRSPPTSTSRGSRYVSIMMLTSSFL